MSWFSNADVHAAKNVDKITARDGATRIGLHTPGLSQLGHGQKLKRALRLKSGQ
jgi:hypothetical protein